MPYAWDTTGTKRTLRLWPHQSLTGRGFRWFIGATALMLALPLLAVLGSVILWVLLIFFAAALAGVWQAIMLNHRRRSLHETLTLSEDRITLKHVPHKGAALTWEANPHWVRVGMRQDGPVENYLTLRGGGREVELGAFLTPEEREMLRDELERALRGG